MAVEVLCYHLTNIQRSVESSIRIYLLIGVDKLGVYNTETKEYVKRRQSISRGFLPIKK